VRSTSPSVRYSASVKLIEGAEDFEKVSGQNYWLDKLY
jgi:hypothetical protein